MVASAAGGASSGGRPSDEATPTGRRPRVRDIVAEGLYIAAAATRLALKNRILVDTIAGGENFDIEHFIPEARATLLQLADEAEAEGERARQESRGAWHKFDDSDGTHDYRSKDVGNLRRRRKQAQRTAHELRKRAADDKALRELIEAAREAAWQEVSRNIDGRLRIEAARPDLEDDYESMRQSRMQALRLVDLARLSAQQRRRHSAAHGEPLEETEAHEQSTVDDGSSELVARARASGIDPSELDL